MIVIAQYFLRNRSLVKSHYYYEFTSKIVFLRECLCIYLWKIIVICVWVDESKLLWSQPGTGKAFLQDMQHPPKKTLCQKSLLLLFIRPHCLGFLKNAFQPVLKNRFTAYVSSTGVEWLKFKISLRSPILG